MKLIILRHGKAEKSAPSGRDDDRPLRPRGIRQAAFVANALIEQGSKPSLILASPIVRALNTAAAIHQITKAPLNVDDRLSTSADVDQALSAAMDHAHLPCLLMVGHNMTFSELVHLLLRPQDRPGGELRTGQAAILQFAKHPQAHQGKLIQYLRDPEVDDE
jgi:phosphohistidine phosphatase